MISKQKRLIDSGNHVFFERNQKKTAVFMQFSQMLMLMKQWWSSVAHCCSITREYQVLTHAAVTARATSLNLTSSWACPDKRAISTRWSSLSHVQRYLSITPATSVPRFRCPSSWANPLCLVPFCWPTSDFSEVGSDFPLIQLISATYGEKETNFSTWNLFECSICCISQFVSLSFRKANIRVGWTRKPSFALQTSHPHADVPSFSRWSVHEAGKKNCWNLQLGGILLRRNHNFLRKAWLQPGVCLCSCLEFF